MERVGTQFRIICCSLADECRQLSGSVHGPGCVHGSGVGIAAVAFASKGMNDSEGLGLRCLLSNAEKNIVAKVSESRRFSARGIRNSWLRGMERKGGAWPNSEAAENLERLRPRDLYSEYTGQELDEERSTRASLPTIYDGKPAEIA